MKKVLITGGLGYIGSKLALELSHYNETESIRIVDNFSHPMAAGIATTLQAQGIEVVREDIRSDEIVKHVRWSEVTYHLAAIVGFPACAKDKDLAISVNVEATKKIVNALDGRRVVYPNTNSGYGTTKGEEACTEESPSKPITLYGMTKVEAEEFIRTNAKDYTIFRLATVYGVSPRPRLDLLVNNFTYKAWKDKYNVIYEGNVMRNYIHISDVVEALGTAGLRINRSQFQNQVFNLGDDNLNCTKLDMARKIQTVVPHEIIEGQVGSDPDKRNYRVSNEKAKKAGFKIDYPFNSGIVELLEQFKILDQPTFGNY